MDEKVQKDFVTHLVGRCGKKPTTAKCYLRNVKIFEKGKILDQISNGDVVQYLADIKLKENKNANTRRLMKTSLETFFAWYAPIVGIDNPTIGLKKIKSYNSNPKLIHPDELERMLFYADQRQDDWGRRACAVLAILADTGIRIEEFEKIKAGDAQLRKDCFELTVPALKGTYSRIVPFSNLLDGGIGEYFSRYYMWVVVEKGQRANAPLFFQLASKYFKKQEDMNAPLLRGGVQYIIDRSKYEAGIDRLISAHQFRHFYGTYSYMNGMDIMSLRQMMGHANISTTQQYIHIADRLSGKILKYSATRDVKISPNMLGYAKLVRELAQKI